MNLILKSFALYINGRCVWFIWLHFNSLHFDLLRGDLALTFM